VWNVNSHSRSLTAGPSLASQPKCPYFNLSAFSEQTFFNNCVRTIIGPRAVFGTRRTSSCSVLHVSFHHIWIINTWLLFMFWDLVRVFINLFLQQKKIWFKTKNCNLNEGLLFNPRPKLRIHELCNISLQPSKQSEYVCLMYLFLVVTSSDPPTYWEFLKKCSWTSTFTFLFFTTKGASSICILQASKDVTRFVPHAGCV